MGYFFLTHTVYAAATETLLTTICKDRCHFEIIVVCAVFGQRHHHITVTLFTIKPQEQHTHTQTHVHKYQLYFV